MNKILIGSQYFFYCYDDFCSKDIDEIQIVDTDEFAQMRQITGQGKCLFIMKKHQSKEDYIDWALKSQLGMVIGKFLVPEFCAEIGFTVEDLPKLKPLIDKLDHEHLYEKIIYDSYITNNSFELTDEQRDRAYKSYNESRNINKQIKIKNGGK
jgi:hypothetical protein